MFSEDELSDWLRAQPLDEPVSIDNESVYLKLHPGGAELGAYLADTYTTIQLHEALKQGFSSAIECDAGLALGPDGTSLVLTQWLPGVTGWAGAASALEQLLNQLPHWRPLLKSVEATRTPSIDNKLERNLRAMFARKT